MLDHFGSGISRDQTCKWGIEWDTCAPESLDRKKATPHQIIFTTSMLSPSLESPLLTIGPKYTRENKTLAGISTSDASSKLMILGPFYHQSA